MTTSSARRHEFAEFLQSRRSRLQPEDVGLPPGARRRVRGLRREEVAQLAGVGLTWYTWLEQGRPITASEQVLASIARALRMTDDERDHLFALAELAVPPRTRTSSVQPQHLDLLGKLLPYPAVAQSARFDLVAYNRAYRFMFHDLDAIAPDQRNCARLIFSDTRWQRAHVDIDHAQGRIASRLRAEYGRFRDQPGWQKFITEFREQSPAFRSVWDRGEVSHESNTSKRLRHATYGELNLTMMRVWLDETMGTRLVWFTPENATTADKLERMARNHSGEPAVTGVAADPSTLSGEAAA